MQLFCECCQCCVKIKQITTSQTELFSPLAPQTVLPALPSSSAESRSINIPSTHIAAMTAAAMTAGLVQPTLSHFQAVWEAIPGISPWVLNIIRHGYTLQFKRRPPRFRGVIQSLTSPQNAHVLRQEVCSLLEKKAIEPVPPSEWESGFYSRYFVVPKKGGGLRPILDLRPVNRALHKRAFRMTTLKQILAQIRPGDWFASVDLKDAYFHIQIVKRHRRFLRFAFENSVYQYTVLPFGLALAPRTFSKCVDAALSPLRSSGMRVLNYLDDWLVLAQSRETLVSHVEALLRHLEMLGLRVNVQKSVLTPSQTTTFLGVCLDSVRMRARLSPERAEALSSSLGLFRPGRLVPLKEFQRLLGRMAAASSVCHLGLLHMRPLQLWLKARVPPSAWYSGHKRIMVTHECVRALAPWRNPHLLSSGVPMGIVTRRVEVLTDASSTGWGAVCLGKPASGRWSEKQMEWHINRLELEAVSLALKVFRPRLEQQHQHFRGLVHKSPRRCTFQSPIQTGGIPSAVGGPILPLGESGAHPRCSKPRGGYALEKRDSPRGVEASPRDGSADMESFRQSGGRPLCDERERALSDVLLAVPFPPGGGRADCAMAESLSLCFSSGKDFAHGVVQNQGGEGGGDSGSPGSRIWWSY